METQSPNLRTAQTKPLPSTAAFRQELPLNLESSLFVESARAQIKAILEGKDKRLLVVMGPCSIHDVQAGMEYARRLKSLSERVSDRMLIVMRAYFSKPRTSIGWTGLMTDPDLDGSGNIEKGLRLCRQFLLDLAALKLPSAIEILNPVSAPYFEDTISWASIGARTARSQPHRQFASVLPMPVGVKNTKDGCVESAIHAVKVMGESQYFIGLDENARPCVCNASGNPYGHVVLRGGSTGPNYSVEAINSVASKLQSAGLNPFVMVDCGHDNSGKDVAVQAEICREQIRNLKSARVSIGGLMLESNLLSGAQSLSPGGQLTYGQSITDPCLSWEQSEALILEAYGALAGA